MLSPFISKAKSFYFQFGKLSLLVELVELEHMEELFHSYFTVEGFKHFVLSVHMAKLFLDEFLKYVNECLAIINWCWVAVETLGLPSVIVLPI